MKFKNTELWGFEHAIRGMRNPMNSWDKSDSCYGCPDGSKYNEKEITSCQECLYEVECNRHKTSYIIGKNDLSLMQKLIRAGSEHRKFLRQIFVSVDITAPIYWWKEFDTYKIGTVANSTSTMHKITSSPFDISHFSCDRMDEESLIHMQSIIEYLEILRLRYIETKDKQIWYDIIQLLPSSYNQTRTCTMNYENILTMYRQRKNHKLNEWSGLDNSNEPNFVGWVKTLPYANELLLI